MGRLVITSNRRLALQWQHKQTRLYLHLHQRCLLQLQRLSQLDTTRTSTATIGHVVAIFNHWLLVTCITTIISTTASFFLMSGQLLAKSSNVLLVSVAVPVKLGKNVISLSLQLLERKAQRLVLYTQNKTSKGNCSYGSLRGRTLQRRQLTQDRNVHGYQTDNEM